MSGASREPLARRASERPAAAILVWAVGVLLILVSMIEMLVAALQGDGGVTTIVAPMAAVTSLLVGAVLVTRLPRHPIGWLLWISGLLFALTRITQGLADHGLTSNPGSIPGAIWFGWVNTWVGTPGFVLLGVLLPLLYPSGRPPSPRWRPVVVAALAETVALSIVAAVTPFASGTYPDGVENPFAPVGRLGDALGMLQAVLFAALFVLLLLALVSLVVRYRRAAGIERQQLRWFAFVGSIAIVALVVAGGGKGVTDGAGSTLDTLAWLMGIGALALMPIAIGIAILRYRLYEIDRIISRTIGWALVSGVLLVVFVGAILVFQAVISPLTGENTVAVAASTLLVAALFQPLRRRVQSRVDRRFDRSRYDAERTVTAFAERLRDGVDLDQLGSEVRTTVVQTVAPVTVTLWLRE